MIRISIKDNPEYISIKQNYKNYSSLEVIALLDLAVYSLRKDFLLSNDEIFELLQDYRKNIKMKEVK